MTPLKLCQLMLPSHIRPSGHEVVVIRTAGLNYFKSKINLAAEPVFDEADNPT